jgi:hypothetical protein
MYIISLAQIHFILDYKLTVSSMQLDTTICTFPNSSIQGSNKEAFTAMSEPDTSLNVSNHDKNIAKDETIGLGPTATKGESGVGEIEETRNGQFHRSFSPRQVHVRIQ